MAILDSEESLILGDIEVNPNLSRSEAESALNSRFLFDNKSDEESREYDDSVRVMFLYANIYDKPGRDVLYSFDDYSLFQKYDGSFFLAMQSCAPFAGKQILRDEFDKDFLKNKSKNEVLEIFNRDSINSIYPSKDFNQLFENRAVSFYAEQRYLCFDYRILFYYSKESPEKLKEDYEEELSHAEKCIDSEIIKAHLTSEYQKALAALKENTWKDLEWEKYRELERKEIIDYKRNRSKEIILEKPHTKFSSSKILKEKIVLLPFIKKSIIAGLCFYFGFSLFGLIVSNDVEFFLGYFNIKAPLSIVFGILFTLRYGKKSDFKYNGTTSSYSIPISAWPDVIHEKFDIKEINFNIQGNYPDWFDCDVFKGDEYGISVEFHGDDFDKSGLPADFSADKKTDSEKVKNEVWEDWFYIDVDHHGAGLGNDIPENMDLEQFFYHNRKVVGIYTCTYKVKNYKTLMEVCTETANLSVKAKLTKNVVFNKDQLNDFTEKVINMPSIPLELKEYFANHFINDLTNIKVKINRETSSEVIFYDSGLIINNAGEEIFKVKIFPNNPDTFYISSLHRQTQKTNYNLP